MEGNPRIIRDLGEESWDEPPLDISAATSVQQATAASGSTKDADKTAPKTATKSASKSASKTASSLIGKI